MEPGSSSRRAAPTPAPGRCAEAFRQASGSKYSGTRTASRSFASPTEAGGRTTARHASPARARRRPRQGLDGPGSADPWRRSPARLGLALRPRTPAPDMRPRSLALPAGFVTLFSLGLAFGTQKGPEDKFRQLAERLPTPNDQRTASGAPGKGYWQQRADYVIDVTLDEVEKRITGKERITYHNHS